MYKTFDAEQRAEFHFDLIDAKETDYKKFNKANVIEAYKELAAENEVLKGLIEELRVNNEKLLIENKRMRGDF